MQNHKLSSLKGSWHVLPLNIADQQRHIERSEALLASIAPGDAPVLYWSQAEPEALVLGFSQKLDALNPDALATCTIPVYHRRAGGTAVLVGPHLLSLDVVLPPDHPLVLPDIVQSYRWFGEAWVAALARIGIQTRVVAQSEAYEQRTRLQEERTRVHEALLRRACYGSLSPYEVASGQRKVVGLDMVRRRRGSLLQAGILLHWETETLARLLGHTSEEQEFLRRGLLERAIGIDTLAGRVVTAEELITAFEQSLTP